MAQTRSEIQKKYDAAHRTPFSITLHNENDADIIKRLSEVESKQGYIKKLIRQDIAGTCSPVPVSMCDEARALLQEEADRQGKDVCDLAKLIINEWLIRQH